MTFDSNEDPEAVPLAHILKEVADKLETLAKSLKERPGTKNIAHDSKIIKEILLATLAATGKQELDNQFVERIVQIILKNKAQ